MIAIPILVLTKAELSRLNFILTTASWTPNHEDCQLCKKLGKALQQWTASDGCAGAILLPKELHRREA